MESLMMASTLAVLLLVFAFALLGRARGLSLFPGGLPWADGALALKRIYLVVAMPSVLGLVFFIPPFGTPDEQDHLRRAAFTASPKASLQHVGATTGSILPSWIHGLTKSISPYYRPRLRASAALLDDFKNVSKDQQEFFQHFQNTAVYPPFFYLPQAASVALGEWIGARPFVIFYVTRLINGLCGVALGVWALHLGQRLRTFLFALLLLPMTLHQLSSLSPDATLIPACLLFVAIYDRASHRGQLSGRAYAGWLLLLLAIATTKVPLVGLGLLPAAALQDVRVPGRSRLWQWAGLLAVGLLVVLWTAYIDRQHIVLRPELVLDTALHRRQLLHAPGTFWRLLVATVGAYGQSYLQAMVGALGRLEYMMPPTALKAGHLAVLAGMANVAAQSWWPRPAQRVAAVGAVAVSLVLLMAVFYITWTAEADPFIQGIQGRYLLYVVAPLPIAVAGLLPSQRLRQLTTTVVLLAGAAALAQMPWFICRTTYLG